MRTEASGIDPTPRRYARNTSPTAPGVTRRWERISDYVKEVGNARVWGGIHYRNSTEVGERMGKEIGRLAASAAMRPAR